MFLQQNSGGLYKNVKMSTKTASAIVLVGIAVFIAVFCFAVNNNGFIIEFDTNGGTEINSIKAMHGDLLIVTETPKKEGYTFVGWYRDKGCTTPWNRTTDTITGSMTLYAGWEKVLQTDNKVES